MHLFRHCIGLLILVFSSSNAWCEDPELIITSQPVSCYGESDGLITINLNNALQVNFEIYLSDSLLRKVGVINQDVTLPYHYTDLHAGIYKIQMRIGAEKTEHSVTIDGPKQLLANKISIEEISGNSSNAIATIKANPSGGTTPYTIEWSENAKGQTGVIAKNLSPGIFKCTIDDANHCGPVSATIFLVETEIEKFLSNKEN